MNKKIFVIGLIGLISAVTLSSTEVNAQLNEKALRYEPNINEDQIIFCVKDTQHKDYFGQISCFVEPADNILDKETTKTIYDKASSLNDTFEMGLID